MTTMPTQYAKIKTKKFDLICMGRVAVDLYAEKIYIPLKDVQSFKKYLGGSPANISVGAARLGLKTSLLSAVGADAMGDFLRQKLESENVDTSQLIKLPNHLTALVILGINPPDNFPLIFYRNNCADMQIKENHILEEALKDCHAFQFSGTGISTEQMRITTQFALTIAKQNNVKIILDIDYRPVLWGMTDIGNGETRYIESNEVSRIYKSFLHFCDLVVGTSEELCILAGTTDVQSAIKEIKSLSNADIIHKNGLQGSTAYLNKSNETISEATFPVEVFNTLGSGDAFMAGLLNALINGKSFSASLQEANACGAIVCSRHGCAPAMPSLQELHLFISGYAKEKDKVLTNSNIARLNYYSNNGLPENHLMLLLAFDHRFLFESSFDNHMKSSPQFDRSYQELNHASAKIKEFKKLVFAAFNKVVDSRKENVMPSIADKKINKFEKFGIICDEQYGHKLLQKCSQQEWPTLAPIELSNSEKLNWLKKSSAYEILLERPSTWGVKVLCNYSTQYSDEMKSHQTQSMQELHKACYKLNRKLMLELIIPPKHTFDGQHVASAIREIYQNGIFPFWWKLQNLHTANDWEIVLQTINEFDDKSRIIVLGGAAKNIYDYQNEFKLLKSYPAINGVAVGRSIFWSAWKQFLNNYSSYQNKISQNHESQNSNNQIDINHNNINQNNSSPNCEIGNAVISEICTNYNLIIDFWENR